MKKKRHTTEEIIRLLRKADEGQTVEEGVCSERRACLYLGLHRSSCQYRAQEALEETRKLVKRIVWLSRKYPRYGYRRIRALLTCFQFVAHSK